MSILIYAIISSFKLNSYVKLFSDKRVVQVRAR